MVKKIPIEHLRPGMRTASPEDSAWLQEPGLYDGVPLVLTDDDIQRIVSGGYREVCVHEEGAFEEATGIEASLAMARRAYLEALKVASQVVMEAAQGGPVDVAGSRKAVRSMLDCVEQDADGLACMARLTPVEAYLGSHMVNVAGISLAFGRSLGLAESELLPLGLAAFLHDMGMTRLPLAVLMGRGMLGEADQAELRKHPLFGARMLQSAGGLSKNIREAVAQHHEHHDGSGYPAGLSGKGISSWARIIHLADVYDGLTRDSSRGRARTPSQALSRMYTMAGEEFLAADVERFVRCMSVYPAGSLVRISTGEAAVVLRTSRQAPTSPVVRVVLDEKGHPLSPRLLDLATEETTVLEPMDSSLRMADLAALAFAS